MILVRYITKELLKIFFAISLILTLIAISNKFVSLLSMAVSGRISLTVVFKMLALYLPEILCIISPIALFLSTLFTISRLYSDSEAHTILGCGAPWSIFLKAPLQLGLIVATLILCSNLWLNPKLSVYRELILSHNNAVGIINLIKPMQFHSTDSGKMVFYVENVEKNKKLNRVFIYQKGQGIITAKEASIKKFNDNSFYLVLKDGIRYQGAINSKNYKITKFSEYGREIKYEKKKVPDFDRTKSTTSLIKFKSSGDIAEFQWRIALPIATLILVIIASGLAVVPPRKSRYRNLLPALIIFISYYNLIIIVKRKIGSSPQYGHSLMLIVHLIYLILGLYLAYKASGMRMLKK